MSRGLETSADQLPEPGMMGWSGRGIWSTSTRSAFFTCSGDMGIKQIRKQMANRLIRVSEKVTKMELHL